MARESTKSKAPWQRGGSAWLQHKKASLVQREVAAKRSDAVGGIVYYTADLQILQNDRITIPHPLRGSTLGSAMRLQHKGAFLR